MNEPKSAAPGMTVRKFVDTTKLIKLGKLAVPYNTTEVNALQAAFKFGSKLKEWVEPTKIVAGREVLTGIVLQSYDAAKTATKLKFKGHIPVVR